LELLPNFLFALLIFVSSIRILVWFVDGHLTLLANAGPAPTVIHDLIGNLTKSFIAAYTPEKIMYAWDHRHSVNFGDHMKLGIDLNFLPFAEFGSTYTGIYKWEIDVGAGFVSIPTAENSNTYELVDPRTHHAGLHRVRAAVTDLKITRPYVTNFWTSATLIITINTTPQFPESGVPINIQFSDKDSRFGYISGTLTFDESQHPLYHTPNDSRQFDYYLVHLNDQPACKYEINRYEEVVINSVDGVCNYGSGRLPTDVRIGVIPYSAGTISFELKDVFVGDVKQTKKWIHVTAYETSGDGAETRQTLTIEVVDLQSESRHYLLTDLFICWR
jgi:hypothetical protein